MILPCSRLQVSSFIPQRKAGTDSGYQGIAQYHHHSYVPKKKPKNGELSSTKNLHLEIFKIVAERYRNRRRRYGLRCNLLAAIYNYELSLSA